MFAVVSVVVGDNVRPSINYGHVSQNFKKFQTCFLYLNRFESNKKLECYSRIIIVIKYNKILFEVLNAWSFWESVVDRPL